MKFSSTSAVTSIVPWPTSTPTNPPPSCHYIATHYLSFTSGYYCVRNSTGSAVNVYCDMDRHCCSGTVGWKRVANIDLTNTNEGCPEGFRLITNSKRVCGRNTGHGCTSITFPVHSVQYSRVCGRVKAYQYGRPEAFAPYYFHNTTSIDNVYGEGVSITHGQSPRQHIWTLAVARSETFSDPYICPCTKTNIPYTGRVPPYIENDYFCDTGTRESAQYGRLYLEDPLWDGEGCGPTSSCCEFNSPPWFCKELPQPTTDDIEFRVCSDIGIDDEDIPFELIELYVQ